MSAHDAWVVAACRTAVARENGALRDLSPEIYGGEVIKEAVRRAAIDPGTIDDVIFGNVMGGGGNMARLAALQAGLPVSTPGITIDRQCGSGMQAVGLAAQLVGAGAGEVYIAGGTESMTRAPYLLERTASAYSRVPPRFFRPRLSPDFIGDPTMGITAENVAERFGISREDQDRFALTSQQRAVAAIRAGKFSREILPIAIPQKKGEPIRFDTDEHPRPDTTYERLAALPPAFKQGGTVTAGSSSGINDGAGAVAVISRQRAEKQGLAPLARVVGTAVAGVDPNIMGMGPVPAVRKLLARTGLAIDQIDLVELNEAFASQALACIRELKLDPEKVNVNGGAIALGHPIAATGAILTCKLLGEMDRRGSRYGIVTACIGGGQGIAVLFERI